MCAAKAKTSSQLQEIAAFRFLPFGVDVFQGSPLRLMRAKHLPLNRPEAMTLEIVEAMAGVIKQGTLAFLARQGGWQKRAVADPGRDDPKQGQRGIGHDQWRGVGRKLHFSARSINATILAYNAVCTSSGIASPAKRLKTSTRKNDYAPTMPLSFKHNGDLLAHHIIWRRLRDANFQVQEMTWHNFGTNPFTQLVRLDTRKKTGENILSRMFADDMAPSWPWLTEYIAESWLLELTTRWDSLERFDRLNRGLADLGEALFEKAVAEERRDLLIVLVEFFRQHLDQEGYEKARLDAFDRIARNLKLSERDEYRRTWARHVTLCWRLKLEYDEARRIHPIDRDSSDKVFMEAVERAPFGDIAQRAHMFSNTLRGVIA